MAAMASSVPPVSLRWRASLSHQPGGLSSASSSGFPWGSDSFSPDTHRLLEEWLASRRLPAQKLALQNAEPGDRGLFATTHIRKGERLLFLPSSLVITTDTKWSIPQCASLLSSEGVPEWPFLASFLISEASQGPNSPWYPYISALPRQPESILLWSAKEINKYLSATSVCGQALERISEVENTYKDMYTSVYSKHPQLFPGHFFTIESFNWAFGVLFSRLVRLQSLDQKVALVPWADMLNHSSQVNACLDYEERSGTVILTTDRSYEPSEQVFISYGEKSKGELLLSYGFVSSDVNEIDSMELGFSLRESDQMLIEKSRALKEHGLSSQCRYPLTIRGIPSQLFAFAYLAVSPPSMFPRFSELALKAASKAGSEVQDVFRSSLYDFTVDTDIEAHEYILGTVEASLSRISKFLMDNQLLSDGIVSRKGGKTFRQQSAKLAMACALCTSEHRILCRVQFVLRNKLRQLRTQKRSKGASLLYGLGKLFK